MSSLFGRCLLDVGPKVPALLVVQKCIIRHPSWWAGHLPTTVSTGEQDHSGWDSKPSLEAAMESCLFRELRGRCEPQSSPWSLGSCSTHRGPSRKESLEDSPDPSRPPLPQTQSEKGLGKERVTKSPVKNCALFLLPPQMTLSEISFARV